MKKTLALSLVLFLVAFFGVSLVTMSCPKPEVISLSTNKGANNQIINLSVTGSKFHKSVYLKLTKDGQPDIVATNVKIVSKTEISCTLDLNGKAVGQWNVIVGNVGTFTKKEKPTLLENAFTISYPALTVSGFSPKEGTNDGAVTLNITGANFRNGLSVKLDKPGAPSIAATNTKVLSPSQISCNLNLDGQTAGTYNLVVTADDGTAVTLAGSFNINPAKPKEAEKVEQPAPAPTPAVVKKPSLDEINQSLQAIFFDFDRYNIRADQNSALAANLAVLKENSGLYISIGGHADERGTRDYNINLSRQRAETISQYLVAQGIDSAKIVIFAYGKDFPAKNAKNQVAWQYNRRVDLGVWEEKPTKDEALKINPNYQ